jgi:hypothetical protein
MGKSALKVLEYSGEVCQRCKSTEASFFGDGIVLEENFRPNAVLTSTNHTIVLFVILF